LTAINLPSFRQKLELLLLSDEQEALACLSEMADRNQFTFTHLKNISEVLLSPRLLKNAQMIVIKQKNEDLKKFLAELGQLVQQSPKAQLVAVLNSAPSAEDLEALPKEEHRLILFSLHDLLQTAKLEYLCLLKNRGTFYDISLRDLFPMTKVGFLGFVRLKLNRIYLPVIYPNVLLSDEKMQRLSRVPSLYINVKDSAPYSEYIKSYYDTSGKSLKKRARALFLQMTWLATNLTQELLCDYQKASPEKLKEIYSAIEEIAGEIMQAIEIDESFWDVFREAFNNDWNQFWRAPWIGLYAAQISKKSGVGYPFVALLTGLLCDIGMLDLPADIYRKYVTGGLPALNEEELKVFQQHPMMSLNRCLSHGLNLSEEVKAAIICTHERFDLKGFPNQTPADKIPFEAFAVQLAEQIDLESRSAPAADSANFRLFREKIWAREMETKSHYGEKFLQTISNALL